MDIDGDELENFGNVGADLLGEELEKLPGQEVPKYIEEYSRKCAVSQRDVNPMLALLSLGGVSRFNAHRAIIKALVSGITARVSEARSQNDSNTIARLLQETMRYLLVDELRPIAVALLEACDVQSMEYNPWDDIIEWGFEKNKPYAALPLHLKVRVWKMCPTAFDVDLETALTQLPDYNPAGAMQDEIETQERLMNMLCSFVKAGGRKFDCLSKILGQLTVAYRRMDQTAAQRLAIANLLLDFLSSDIFSSANPTTATFAMTASHVTLVRAAGWLVLFMKRVHANDKTLQGDDLQKLRTLLSFFDSPDMVRVLSIMLHAASVRDLLVTKIVWAVENFAKGPYGNEADLPELGAILKEKASTLAELILLLDCSVRTKSILDDPQPLQEASINPLFAGFFPMFVREVRADNMAFDNGSLSLTALPKKEFRTVVQETMESMIFCRYARGLIVDRESSVDRPVVQACLSRYRLVLDDIYGRARADAGSTPGDGVRLASCQELITVICDDAAGYEDELMPNLS